MSGEHKMDQVVAKQWLAGTIGPKIGNLISNDELELRSIVGPKVWDQGTPGFRRFAGRCFSEMVEAGQLPFRFVRTKSDHHNVYVYVPNLNEN